MLIHYSIIWLKAIRPFTLPASVVPVFIGAALASQQQQWSPLLLLIILIGTILVQIGTNLIDEYVDHKPIQKNVDKLPPYKVIALGLLSRNTVRLASILAYLLATIIGISLANALVEISEKVKIKLIIITFSFTLMWQSIIY